MSPKKKTDKVNQDSLIATPEEKSKPGLEQAKPSLISTSTSALKEEESEILKKNPLKMIDSLTQNLQKETSTCNPLTES